MGYVFTLPLPLACPSPHNKSPFSVLHHFSLSLSLSLFLTVLVFELRDSSLLERDSITWMTPSALFGVGYFQDGASQTIWTICPSWSWTRILQISTLWLAGIIDMRSPCLFIWHREVSSQTWHVESQEFEPWVQNSSFTKMHNSSRFLRKKTLQLNFPTLKRLRKDQNSTPRS
jgi:hypothetical protein